MTKEATHNWDLDKFAGEAIIIAFFTGWAYLITFYYESGYLSYFGLSKKLIVIEMSSVLIALTALVSFLIFLGSIGYYFMSTKDIKTEKEKEMWAISLIFFFIVMIPFYLFGFSSKVLPGLLGFGFFILVRLLSIFFLTKGNSLEDKLKKEHEKRKKNDDGPLDWMHTKLGSNWFYKVLFLFFSLYLAQAIGESNAMKQRNFYIIEGQPELVIVTMYGNRILAMPVDRSNRTLEHKVYILETGNLAESHKGVSIQKLGKLSLNQSNEE